MRLAALLGAALLLSSATPSAKPPGRSAQGPHLVDLTPDFDRAWRATAALPDDQRVAAFEGRFEKVLPGFYSAARVKDFIRPERYRQLVIEGLKTYPQKRAGIQRVSREFPVLIARARGEFESVFGPVRGYPPVYLVISFGEFDGGTRDLPEGTRLMFGADMIDRLYRHQPIKPFLQHELFHLIHHRTFPDCDFVWCNLWEEGLATYVAARLNPGASDAALGLTIPAPLRTAVSAHRAEAICAVRARLHSKDPADYGPLFLGGDAPLSPHLPRRFGYYVGLLMLEDAGRTRSLKQLADMKPEQVSRLVEATLARMANCPPPEPTLTPPPHSESVPGA
jgi:hypothetical protein